MSDAFLDRSAEAPTMEVRVFRHGKEIHRELCESEEQALLVVADWSEIEGVECEIRDLSSPEPAGLSEEEPVEGDETSYPDAVELQHLVADAYRRQD